MKKTVHKIFRASFPVVILCAGFFVCEASEVFSTTDSMGNRSWALSVYGLETKTKPVIRISGGGSVPVPVSGGNSTIFSNENADLKMEQQSSEVVAAADFHPGEGLTYRFKVGQV